MIHNYFQNHPINPQQPSAADDQDVSGPPHHVLQPDAQMGSDVVDAKGEHDSLGEIHGICICHIYIYIYIHTTHRNS